MPPLEKKWLYFGNLYIFLIKKSCAVFKNDFELSDLLVLKVYLTSQNGSKYFTWKSTYTTMFNFPFLNIFSYMLLLKEISKYEFVLLVFFLYFHMYFLSIFWLFYVFKYSAILQRKFIFLSFFIYLFLKEIIKKKKRRNY